MLHFSNYSNISITCNIFHSQILIKQEHYGACRITKGLLTLPTVGYLMINQLNRYIKHQANCQK